MTKLKAIIRVIIRWIGGNFYMAKSKEKPVLVKAKASSKKVKKALKKK